MGRINEAIDFENPDTNFKYPFSVMTKKYGREFIEHLKAAWLANGDSQTKEEFCRMNGLPMDFFNKTIYK